MSNLLSYH